MMAQLPKRLMASKRRMMTLNAFSLYGALGNESSTSSSTSSSTPLLPPPSATSSSSGDGDGEPSSSKRPRNDGDSSSPPPTTTTTEEQFLGGKSHANGIAPIRNDTEDRSGSGENDSASNQAPPSTTSGKGVEMAKMLRSVCGWRKGEREEMQDAHVLEDQFGLCATDIKRSAFYAIFDGHAGRRASQFCSQRIPSMVKDKLSACKSISEMENAMKRIFVECYRQVDEQFLAQARRVRPTWKDGTTATTVIILNSIVYCANIGDSRAVVCRKKSDGSVVALQLTVDHSPLQFEERMRIQRAGGTVKDGRILGVLEVSRSIGDGQFKAHGVTCLPDVKKFSITQEDRFILIACDGLWKTFSNQEAIEFVLQKSKQTIQAEKSSKEESSSLVDSRYSTWEQTAGEIAAESVRRGCGDNVSVIIVVLDDSVE